LSGRETGYIRNRVLLAALREHFDVDVLTWDVQAGIAARTAGGLARFAWRRPEHDVCFAGFFGQPIALALGWAQRKPIILDAYVSAFDTLCDDRAQFRPDSALGRLAHWLDRRSCQAAAQIITDTAADAQYFETTFGLSPDRITPVYVGCDETVFFPRPAPAQDSGRCEVFYYGAFLPLHGSEVIIRAAALLRRRPDIHFTLGGEGMGYSDARRLVAGLGLRNLDLVGWIPFERLPDYIAAATICLGGHYSLIPKAARVIATKAFQFVAMRKPTIVGDNAATRELFVPGEHVLAVPMGDPAALASAVERLADDAALRDRIAAAGYARYRERLTTPAIATELAEVVAAAMKAGPRP
jgi:glycosyltransferase involved in cell wall biosynthesis